MYSIVYNSLNQCSLPRSTFWWNSSPNISTIGPKCPSPIVVPSGVDMDRTTARMANHSDVFRHNHLICIMVIIENDNRLYTSNIFNRSHFTWTWMLLAVPSKIYENMVTVRFQINYLIFVFGDTFMTVLLYGYTAEIRRYRNKVVESFMMVTLSRIWRESVITNHGC